MKRNSRNRSYRGGGDTKHESFAKWPIILLIIAIIVAVVLIYYQEIRNS